MLLPRHPLYGGCLDIFREEGKRCKIQVININEITVLIFFLSDAIIYPYVETEVIL